MKRLIKKIAVLLSLTMILALAACGGEDPAKVWDEAAAKNAALSDLDMTMSMDMTMEIESESIDIAMDMAMKMNGINTEKMLYAADTNMSMDMGDFDFDMDGSTYYADGYCYTEMMGQKMKYAMDLDTMMKSVEQNNAAAGLDSASMQELTMKEDGDNRIISFVCNPKAMNESMEGIMEMMEGQLAMLGDVDIKTEMKEIKGECVINKDGYNTRTNMTMVFEMEVEGMTCSVTADTVTELKNPGQPVEVTIPDMDGYEEINY